MNLFERADEHSKEDLIEKLINGFGYTKMPDGKQLYEISFEELRELYLMELLIEGETQREL